MAELSMDHSLERIAEKTAIEAYCRVETAVRRVEVHAQRLDDGSARGLADFLVDRGGDICVVEHTELATYRVERPDGTTLSRQALESVWWKHLIESGVRDDISAMFPNYLIRVGIPMHDFCCLQSSRRVAAVNAISTIVVERVNRLIEEERERKARALVPGISFRSRPRRHDKIGIDGFYFTVDLQVTKIRPGRCSFVGLVPVASDTELRDRLDEDITYAISTNIDKLLRHKQLQSDLRTVLLLDSLDYALVSIDSLSESFSRAARGMTLEGLDEIYILHGRVGPLMLAPVKIGDRLFPDIDEYNRYIAVC